MNKKLRIFLATMMTISVISSGLAGCGSGKTEPAAATKEATSTAAAATVEEKFTKYDPGVTLTAVKNVSGDTKFKNGETIDNNILSKTIKDELGIDIKYLWTTSDVSAYGQKLRLMLASAADIPDFFQVVNDQPLIGQLISSGNFLEVDDAFNKYAGPKMKAAFEKYPEAWYTVTSSTDGKKYGIPAMRYLHNGDQVLWIREDWMKKLNLNAPETIDDLEKVLDAFTNQDPDGNGKKDTFGLAMALKATATGALPINTWMGSSDFVTGAYGTIPAFWSKYSGDKLEIGNIQPGMKDALAKLNSWYTKGYISKDTALFDEMKAAEQFNSGKAGVIAGCYWMSIWPLPDLKKNVPGSEIKAYPLPVGPNGKTVLHTDNAAGGDATLIRKDVKNPDAVIRYLNWFYENSGAGVEKGSKHEYGVAENYDWQMIDGKPSNDKNKVKDHVNVWLYSVTQTEARIPDAITDALTKFVNGGQPETPFEITTYGGTDEYSRYAAKILLDQIQKGYPMFNLYNSAPTPTMISKQAILDKLEGETQIEIIYGKKPADSFDQFVAKYNELGGAKIAEEVNAWYKSVGGK